MIHNRHQQGNFVSCKEINNRYIFRPSHGTVVGFDKNTERFGEKSVIKDDLARNTACASFSPAALGPPNGNILNNIGLWSRDRLFRIFTSHIQAPLFIACPF